MKLRDSIRREHPRLRTVRRCAAACFLWSGLAAAAAAQDRVTFLPEGASRPVTLVGEILDSTGRQVKLRTAGGQQQYIPADAVAEIQTEYDPAHQQGLELLLQGNASDAAAALRTALARERREWVQREILAALLRCAQREGNLAGALDSFRMILGSDSATRHWRIAPLVWTPVSLSDPLRRDARDWLQSSSSADRLLGASLLLADPVSGAAASRELDRLASDLDQSVSSLAKAQRWRRDLVGGTVTVLQVESWRSFVESLPVNLRSGPQSLLAQGFAAAGESRRAAAEWMWIPVAFPENEPLAARALLEAAESLERSGLSAEAVSLYRELVSHYGWSREATQARGRLADAESDPPLPAPRSPETPNRKPLP